MKNHHAGKIERSNISGKKPFNLASVVDDLTGLSVPTLDLETDPFKEGRLEISPFVAGLFDGKMIHVIWGDDCIPRLVSQLKKLLPGTIVYAHNGGNFDFHFLLEFIPVEDCEFMTMGKRIVRIKLPWDVELRDSFAIVPKKLAAFDKDEIDYRKFERPVREKHREEIVKYLKKDLLSLSRMVTGFIKRFPMELTLASSVFKLMKTDFDYDPGRSSESYDRKFRQFFFGGRVEFWKLGEVLGKFVIVDINSAYPWAMTKDHWFGFTNTAQQPKKREDRNQCLYIVECSARGCFPLRQKNNSVAFPYMHGRFCVTGWELEAALRLKLVDKLEILACYAPDAVADMAAFANTLYDRKREAKEAGDKEEEFFNKIAVNAGYGKLALNPERFNEVKVTEFLNRPDYISIKTGKVISEATAEKQGQPLWVNCWDDKDRGLSFWKRSSYRPGIDKFINVATAASITGCVRAYLLETKEKCGGAIYADTDSLILSNTKPLKIGERLGEWKEELFIDSSKYGYYDSKDENTGKVTRIKQRSGVWIAGKKLYAAFGQDAEGKWKWKKASKGVSLSPERIMQVALGRAETMTFKAPTYSLFSPPKFVTREVRRSDQRKH